MKTRKDLPFLLNKRGLKGEGVEVGVAEGKFARHVLTFWRGAKLHLVDPYRFQGGVLDRSDRQDQHDYNLGGIHNLIKWSKGRAELIQDFSTNVAWKFANNSLDFVYIDAKHDFRSVWNDIEAWYPKVRSGGVLAGHDYKNSCVRRNLVEVKTAVDRWVMSRPFEVKLQTTTEDNLPTWFIIKS